MTIETTTATVSTLADLKAFPQWVCFTPDKHPYNARTGGHAMSDTPTTWAAHDVAFHAFKKKTNTDREQYAGVGYVLCAEQGLTVVDLDDSLDEQGNLTPWAEYVVRLINSYTEVSPSGRGLHIWVKGNIPKKIAPDTSTPDLIEMDDHGKYYTVTGNHLEHTPATFEDRQEELLALYNEVVEKRARAKAATQTAPGKASPTNALSPSGDTPYALAALEKECAEMSSTGEGGRNAQLFSSAAALGQLIAGGELSESLAMDRLADAAQQSGLPDREIETAIKSGLKYGKTQPRNTPEKTAQTETNNGSSRNGYYIPPPAPLPDKPFNPTDLGNAERFALRYKDTVRWCETWSSWMVFNGKCWEQDKIGRVDQLAKIIVRGIYKEAAATDDEDTRKRLAKHAAASESNRSVRAMLDRSKSELPATPDDFNTHLNLLNCDNGTLDLRTGELHPHNPNDMLTRCIKIKYNPLARSGLWESFLAKFLDNDPDLITFMKQALGMSLCGDTSEQCLFICHGMGSNGKTTMLETVRIIMASYACAANIETFQVRKSETIGNDIAELYGARMVTASETKLGGRLNEAFVKKATGKEPLRARRLHENEFEFMPEFTLWLAVNHKPVVLDTSKGMWRRVHFIPFNVTIDGDQVDKHFGDKLLDESEGILAWLVQGCMEWMRQGRLVIPKIVQEATEGYKAEMDIVSNFLRDECTQAPGMKTQTRKLIERFESWCGHNSEKFDAKLLKDSLKEKGLKSQKGTGGVYYWQGIGLTDNEQITDIPMWDEENSGRTEKFLSSDSGRSGRSGPKNKVNQEIKNPPDATLNSRPLRPLRPLFDSEENITPQTPQSVLNDEKTEIQYPAKPAMCFNHEQVPAIDGKRCKRCADEINAFKKKGLSLAEQLHYPTLKIGRAELQGQERYTREIERSNSEIYLGDIVRGLESYAKQQRA